MGAMRRRSRSAADPAFLAALDGHGFFRSPDESGRVSASLSR